MAFASVFCFCNTGLGGFFFTTTGFSIIPPRLDANAAWHLKADLPGLPVFLSPQALSNSCVAVCGLPPLWFLHCLFTPATLISSSGKVPLPSLVDILQLECPPNIPAFSDSPSSMEKRQAVRSPLPVQFPGSCPFLSLRLSRSWMMPH